MTKTSVNKKRIKTRYLNVSEESNALDYLEQACAHIQRTADDKMAWKWVVLCLHGALYGFAVCAAKGTNAEATVTKTNGKLLDFSDAIKRCQNAKRMKMTVFSQPLVLTRNQKNSVKRLHEVFRNQFIHYKPKLWFIEIHDFPLIALYGLEVIQFLALETGNYTHLSLSEKHKIKTLMFRTMRWIRTSDLYLETIAAIEMEKPKSKVKKRVKK